MRIKKMMLKKKMTLRKKILSKMEEELEMLITRTLLLCLRKRGKSISLS